MATWPGGLLQSPMREGFSQSFEDNLLRTNMDAGVAKQRLRTTSGPKTVRCKVFLNDATDLSTFTTFFNTTINYGADEFEWTDHVEGGTVNYRFIRPPTISKKGSSSWIVDMELEIIP